MRNLLRAYKPAAPARLHLLLAAGMWTAVATLLLLFGIRWTWMAHTPYFWPLVAAAVALGLVKARFVLDRTTVRMIERIRTRGDGRCIGGFQSLRSWAFVLLMMAAGRLLRGSPLPRIIVALLYLTVGTALLLATRRLWHAWRTHDSGS